MQWHLLADRDQVEVRRRGVEISPQMAVTGGESYSKTSSHELRCVIVMYEAGVVLSDMCLVSCSFVIAFPLKFPSSNLRGVPFNDQLVSLPTNQKILSFISLLETRNSKYS